MLIIIVMLVMMMMMMMMMVVKMIMMTIATMRPRITLARIIDMLVIMPTTPSLPPSLKNVPF